MREASSYSPAGVLVGVYPPLGAPMIGVNLAPVCVCVCVCACTCACVHVCARVRDGGETYHMAKMIFKSSVIIS